MYDFLGPPPKRKAGARGQVQRPVNPYDYLGPPLTLAGFPRYQFLQGKSDPDPVSLVSQDATELYSPPAPLPEITRKVMGPLDPELTRTVLSGRPKIDGVLGRHAMGPSPEQIAQVRSHASEMASPVHDVVSQRRAQEHPSSSKPVKRSNIVAPSVLPNVNPNAAFWASEKGEFGLSRDWRRDVEELLKPSPPPDPVEVRNKVAQWAEAKARAGNTDYQLMDPNDRVGGKFRGNWLHGRGAYKCNIFVGDAYSSARVSLLNPQNGNFYFTAEDWGDPKSVIPGFRSLKAGENPVRGDIITNGSHVGIYMPVHGRKLTVSAAAPSKGDKVVHNDWGFRGDEGPITYWRYVGEPAQRGRRP